MAAALLGGFALAACTGLSSEARWPTPLERITTHASFVADPALNGRRPGTPGHERAAAYLVEHLESIGLEPAFVDADGGLTYRQWFRIGESGPTVANIAGVIPGRGELADRYIVLGAHYDHIGHGDGPRLIRDRTRGGDVHPGADDNASGVAALLAAAEMTHRRRTNRARPVDPRSSMPPPPQRSVLVTFFTAEEAGLVGSRYLLDASRFGAANVDAMINLDMVGRLDDQSTLHVWGVGTASDNQWVVVTDLAEGVGFEVVGEPSGWGPSDYASFTDAGIPAIHLITLNNDDYHTPDDTFARLNLEGIARVAELVNLMVPFLDDVLPFRFAETGPMPHPFDAGTPPVSGAARSGSLVPVDR
ncbi:MAG: M28 family peptidase [Planctomycetota bacterium]